MTIVEKVGGPLGNPAHGHRTHGPSIKWPASTHTVIRWANGTKAHSENVVGSRHQVPRRMLGVAKRENKGGIRTDVLSFARTVTSIEPLCSSSHVLIHARRVTRRGTTYVRQPTVCEPESSSRWNASAEYVGFSDERTGTK